MRCTRKVDLPGDLADAIDADREARGQSFSEWVEAACRLALTAPTEHDVRLLQRPDILAVLADAEAHPERRVRGRERRIADGGDP